MRELPILFSGPMVRAILDGSKTQTRRVMKLQPDARTTEVSVCRDQWMGIGPSGIGVGTSQWDPWRKSRFAADYRLWVRETFAHMYRGNTTPETRRDDDVVYRADGFTPDEYVYGTWKPSIHMPRWASRITLKITGVRVERLQHISETDARAEGVTIEEHLARGYCAGADRPPSIRAYRDLWDGLNAARGHGWEANPWVWVVEFQRVAQPAGA
ncbi:hypothetical protein [Burkholderia cepacia]|uniref:ASCH domain-containing protein n=1 Tax=Burkholderia cepacia GG4 TaxID=1009846 RepID=A0A9W3K3X2_BURCE|nr:hypothetical protein [Burkholderia cepacia]AFQ50409.1 hypothetical protein GEM_4019 [Burkholderia cepacia GG4]